MLVSRDELRELIYANLEVARAALDRLRLEKSDKRAAAMLSDTSVARRLMIGTAEKVWAVSLFVDMRASTRRALQIGPGKTYLTMHALIPALAHVVKTAEGFVVGYRGDGLFAVFGLDERGMDVPPSERSEAVQMASMAGKAMVEALEAEVNPALDRYDVPPIGAIGVGVSAGEILLTRIGLSDGFDVTAYGDSVNGASKLCSAADNSVILSPDARDFYPRSDRGRASFKRHGSGGDEVSLPIKMLM